MEFLEALASQFIRCKRILVSNSSMARAMRAVKDRNSFDKIHVHEEMLADSVRMSAYRAAIQRYVNSQDHVVDIGTGTGVLAFFAAAKNPRKLYALDHSKKMIKYARAAAEANGIANVTFVASSSYKFRPAEPIDVLIQEQMGYALFEEGMLEVILDVRDRCLKPGGRILPAKFEFYLEPVQLLEQERIPLIQEQRLYGLTFPRARAGPNSGYYFRRHRSRRCRVSALRPRTGVHLRPYDVDARPASEAILRKQADHPGRPSRRYLHVFQSDLR